MTDSAVMETLITDHMAGALPPPLMLFADSLIDLNKDARRTHDSLAAAAGVMLEQLAPAAMATDALDKLLDRLDTLPSSDTSPKASNSNLADTDLPASLRAHLPDRLDHLPWKRLGGGVREYALDLTMPGYKISLLDIPPGTSIPMHTHRGHEYTLVLRGAFSDAFGKMNIGDFIRMDATNTHAPVADTRDGCLCLAVLDAPLRFKGILGWLINPFLKV